MLRKISKLARKGMPGKGKAVIGFEIAGNGGLARVVILTSAGSAALYQTALDHIRRAAPFEPPPAEAQRRYSFEFVAK